MNQRKRNRINDFVENIREILELTIPTDVHEMVGILQGKIIYENSADGKEAKIEKIDDAEFNFRITLPEYTSEIRDRFTVAHELGHLFLHMGYLIDEEKWEKTPLYQDSAYYRFGHSDEEYEANEFAAALLMPKKDFFKVAKENLDNGKYDVKNISEKFNVSTEAVKNRGRWLGLFSWSDY